MYVWKKQILTSIIIDDGSENNKRISLFRAQFILALLLLLLKKVGSARLGESDIHPISPKTPSLQYQHIDGKKRKGKRVEDYSRDRAD